MCEFLRQMTQTFSAAFLGTIFAIALSKIDFMERELLIALRKNNTDKKKIDQEVENIKRLFPYLESFQTFTKSHTVLDLEKHVIVNERKALHSIFSKGIHKYSNFILGLN